MHEPHICPMRLIVCIGAPAEINETNYGRRVRRQKQGCPSDRCDLLDEADEITEVNGRVLDNWILSDIADYIHRCIHSRTICVRIKPKKSQEKGTSFVYFLDKHIPASRSSYLPRRETWL
ncbi:stardust1 protein [Nephila pilipes]|uniref:Stardust1 protein n=1 Tax=Nephila pilipes TaxID=299642 RepID=A0A8X6U435_NEPPI|nr:stardust1 protein [Nephila pilipes]